MASDRPAEASFDRRHTDAPHHRRARVLDDRIDHLGAREPRQDYPLDRVELILVGSEAQYRDWREMASEERRFRRVVTVEAEGVLYYELKNRGAARASGEIAPPR